MSGISDYLDSEYLDLLSIVAPGTELREALEDILRARSGALVVVGDGEAVMERADGGVPVGAEFTPSRLYELAKMDGAVLLDGELEEIAYANVHLRPRKPSPSMETGIRHRTAERFARETDQLVIAISQRRSVITLYRGDLRCVLQDVSLILTKANQALQTLERYFAVMEEAMNHLTAMELAGLVTVMDVAAAIQRIETVLRFGAEVERYACELGVEGRLITMQMQELVENVDREELLLIRDYQAVPGEPPPDAVSGGWRKADDDLVDLLEISRSLGHGFRNTDLEAPVRPRGYRILSRVPRLPMSVIENLVEVFGSLEGIMDADLEELDEVDGVGEVRAQAVKEGLQRLKEQTDIGKRRF